ncbi:MAG: hypothetical protein FWG59_00150 [Betaproteobacteria bacterium]|nr:hypothetical protein [Betaproteobacteria bacterium]
MYGHGLDLGRALSATLRQGEEEGKGCPLLDDPMSKAAGEILRRIDFSGVPATSGGGYAAALRLAAAKSGCETIMVYWGVLETAQKGHSDKVISWLPIVGGMMPDESQEMRIRLKTALTVLLGRAYQKSPVLNGTIFWEGYNSLPCSNLHDAQIRHRRE